MSVAPERIVRFNAGPLPVAGDLWIPEGAGALVVLADGTAGSRFHPRHRHVARLLNKRRIATLLADLTAVDDFVAATDWILQEPDTRTLALGYQGFGRGAGAALAAAALRAKAVGATVSAGGRLDAAADALADVLPPTLFIVGGNDAEGIRVAQAAVEVMPGTKQVLVIPGASALFEGKALDEMAGHARDWFLRHLVPAALSSAA
jgi:putative phosphoribosyl transferase